MFVLLGMKGKDQSPAGTKTEKNNSRGENPQVCQWQKEVQGKCKSAAGCRRKSDLLSAEWKRLKCTRPSLYQFSEVQTAPDLWVC